MSVFDAATSGCETAQLFFPFIIPAHWRFVPSPEPR